MQVNFDHFNRPENPELSICNPNNTSLASIVSYSNLDIKPTFNGLSELSVNVYKYIRDKDIGIIDTSRACECYQYIALHRYIHVENLGYFIITQSTEKNDGINPYSDIKASSCELELNNRKIKIDAGNYKFYDPQFPSMSIMGKVLALCPTWSLGNIPQSVLNTYRSFDDTNQGIYTFLSNDIGKAFGCICDFDIENRVINVIDLNSEIESTDVFLTYNNVVKNLDINQTADNIITALTVSGSNDLSISEVNPLGTNYIVDFSYYKNTDWMSQSLIDAINTWEKKVSDNQAKLDSLLSVIKQHKTEFENLNNSLATLQSELKILEDEKSDLSSDGKDYSSVQAQINIKNTEISNKNNEIISKQTEINNDYSRLSNLQNSLKLENNFTANQYSELSNFIFENDYKNEYIEADSNYTYAQKQELQYALYADGLKKLKKICQPVSSFEIDCNNFLLIPEFNVFRDQFELGKIIHVETSPDNRVDMMLLQYEINYENKELKIKVSNQMKIHDRFTAYQEVYTKAAKANNTIAESKSTWDYAVKSGKIDDFEAFRTGALNATLNKVISSTNEDISIDNTGIHGRAKDPSTGKFEKEEMWLNKNNLLFSDDNFQTAKTALGKITLPNGKVVYGLVADAIVAGTIDAGTIDVIHLVADNITTGTLQSANGKYSLDMDTGEVNMKSGTFSGNISWPDSNGIEAGSIKYGGQAGLIISAGNGITFEGAGVSFPYHTPVYIGYLDVSDLRTNGIEGKTTQVGITRSDGSTRTLQFTNGILTDNDV
ncbi:hypothetical protein [Caproiciproducens sp. CPB-2]|uniref:hypothetical protein n=1 Tax=Caproiciproducens sp. CPB-2 TaxID=3030017 RepID=UPI0023D9AF78|nr:hypothetical protein [Caproiciproducens sp. CPB-2]MDF1496344.1 hypothetical protein [Caproiciproducens sp. CPB-2]